MSLSSGMTIVELDDLIKSLPKERLQAELERPTGHFPLYLVAGRLKEIESMTADAQAAAATEKAAEQPPSVAHRLAMMQPPVMSEVAAAPQPQPQPSPAGQAAQMLTPTVNAKTGSEGLISELVNKYLADKKLKKTKDSEFAVPNSSGFAGGSSKQPFNKSNPTETGGLASLVAAKVIGEERRANPTPSASFVDDGGVSKMRPGKFSGGARGAHGKMATARKGTPKISVMDVLNELGKRRQTKKAKHGGYVGGLPTIYAQTGLDMIDAYRRRDKGISNPRNITRPSSEEKIYDNVLKRRELQRQIYEGVGKTDPFEINRMVERLDPAANLRGGLTAMGEVAAFPRRVPESETRGPEPRHEADPVGDVNQLGQAPLKVAESPTDRQERLAANARLGASSRGIDVYGHSIDGEQPQTTIPVLSGGLPHHPREGDRVVFEPPYPSELGSVPEGYEEKIRKLEAEAQATQADKEDAGKPSTGGLLSATVAAGPPTVPQADAGVKAGEKPKVVEPPKTGSAIPFREDALGVFDKFDKGVLAHNITSANKKIDAPKASKIVSTFAAELQKQGVRLDQISTDRQSVYDQIRGAITEKGKTAKEQLKILEDSQKAINEFTETGKLPKARRDRVINNILISLGASLLGNSTLTGALSDGLMAIQKIRSGEEDAYADGLVKNLEAAKKLGDLRIKISDTKQQGIVELAKLKQADSKFDFEAVQRHTANLLKLKQIEETSKYNSINAAANMKNAETNQFKATTDPKIAVPLEYYRSQYSAYRDKYIAALGEDKNQAAADAVTQKWKKWFSVDPKTGILDPDRPVLERFAPLIRKDARLQKTPLYPTLPRDKFVASTRRNIRRDHEAFLSPKNRSVRMEWWRDNLRAEHGDWTGSSEQKSILSNSYRAYLEKEAAGGAGSKATLRYDPNKQTVTR